jgi:hypothetical protein
MMVQVMNEPMNTAAIETDDAIAAKRQALRANLARYARLLATELTQLERDYIHRRVREERLALEALARDEMSAGGTIGFARTKQQSHAAGHAGVAAP